MSTILDCYEALDYDEPAEAAEEHIHMQESEQFDSSLGRDSDARTPDERPWGGSQDTSRWEQPAVPSGYISGESILS